MHGYPGGNAVTPDYPDTHYARTRTQAPPRPPLAGAIEADVCVIGGGLAGLSTALGLAERGRRVALVEANRLGWGASGRNGGFLGAGYALHGPALVERVGLDDARWAYGLTRKAIALVAGRVERYAIACDLERTGHMWAAWFDEPDATRKRRAWMAETFGVELEHWPRERIREAYRTTRYHEGLLNPAGYQFHPLNYALGLARAAEGQGASLYEGSPAVALETQGGRHIVRTPAGRIAAEHVVVAGGGYLRGLDARISGAVLPIGTYVGTTAPLGPRIEDALRVRYATSDTRWSFDYYRRLADTRILWGWGVSARRGDPHGLAEQTRHCLLRVFPQLADARIETAWGGLMSYARHRMPQVGQLEPGLWYAQAFGGHGMGTTTVAGELIAAAIAEGDDAWRRFARFGLDRAWGLAGSAVAQATYWTYRLKDALKQRRAA